MPSPNCCIFTMAFLVSCINAKIIDLSHKHGLNTWMPIPGAPGYNLTLLDRSSKLGVYIEFNYYGSSEHGGTHMDAPSHFVPGGMTIDDIPIEHTVLESVMLDFSKEGAANHSYAVHVQALKDWETIHGRIPREGAVLFYFGWYQKFENERLYRGTDNVGDLLSYEYPYVTYEAAKWLVDERRVRAVGSDTLSVDCFQVNNKPSKFPIHTLLLPVNRTIIENLRDLDKLPARNFRFHFSPVKYVGAGGTQVRAYAMTYEDKENRAGFAHVSWIIAVWGAVLLKVT